MKPSVNKIFKNLNLSLLIILFLMLISLLFVVEQYYSYQKVENLNNQKTILNEMLDLQKKSDAIDVIQYNSKIALLHSQTNKLINQVQYNYISSYILKNTKSSTQQLHKLNTLVKNFDKKAREHLKLGSNSNITISQKKLRQINHSIQLFIDSIILTDITNDLYKFNIFYKIFLLLFLMLLITTFWYKTRLTNIYKDILFLYSPKKNTTIFSQEITEIASRMKRKTQTSSNPAMIDSITGLNNNKGMINSYMQSKSMKSTNFHAITILEIDNFSKSKRTFSQEFTQDILKKVAYTISLHGQVNDIIARTDYNQFTLIFSRTSKERLFKDADLVRQSISEIQLKTPQKETINITVTGAFKIKANNSSLDDSLKNVKKLLEDAKCINKTNKIFQIKDLQQ